MHFKMFFLKERVKHMMGIYGHLFALSIIKYQFGLIHEYAFICSTGIKGK